MKHGLGMLIMDKGSILFGTSVVIQVTGNPMLFQANVSIWAKI